jgi:hypothetical protein
MLAVAGRSDGGTPTDADLCCGGSRAGVPSIPSGAGSRPAASGPVSDGSDGSDGSFGFDGAMPTDQTPLLSATSLDFDAAGVSGLSPLSATCSDGSGEPFWAKGDVVPSGGAGGCPGALAFPGGLCLPPGFSDAKAGLGGGWDAASTSSSVSLSGSVGGGGPSISIALGAPIGTNRGPLVHRTPLPIHAPPLPRPTPPTCEQSRACVTP